MNIFPNENPNTFHISTWITLNCPLCNNCNVEFNPNHNSSFISINFPSHHSTSIPPHRLYVTIFDGELDNIYIYLDNSLFFTISTAFNKIMFGIFGPVQVSTNSNYNKRICIELPLSYLNFNLDYFSILNFIETQLAFQ